MAIVGCLGDIVFQVSSETVATINNATWSGSATYATHQRHGTHALTEFVGINPDKMTFDIELNLFLGCNPMDAINLLWGYERSGEAVPLTIGEKGYGKYRWNILSHNTKMSSFDGEGHLTTATVSVSLQEYLMS